MHTFYTRLLILLVLLAPLTAYAAGDLAPGGGAIGGLPSPYGSEGDCLLITGGVPAWGACPGAGSGAPADAKYIVQTANGTLSAEQALATLATGIMKVTTTTGVVSVAVKGTDYPGLDFANVFTTAQTFQPATDVITGTFRRNGAAQTANIIEIQTEANALLASIDKTGAIVAPSFTGNVTGAVTGNASTATALAANPTDCSANNFATTIAANGDLTCGQPSISAGVSGLGTGVATFLGTPSSANLGSALTDETGSGGGFVRATAPTIDSPVLSTKVNLPRVTALPGTPSAGDTVIVTDDSAAGACDSAAGSATTICQYSGSAWAAIGDGNSGSGAPTNATYIVQTANGSLSNEQALGALSTGCLGSATTTGVVSARTITGTANQISVANGDCSGAPTISIPTNPTLPGTVSATAFTATGASTGIVQMNGVTSGAFKLTTPDATGQTVTLQPAAQTSGAATFTLQDAAGVNQTIVTLAQAQTLTNKTLDAEGTGNVITIPKRLWFPAAGCNNATAGSVWDLPTSNPAVAACVTGTNTQKGVLDFADGANPLSAQTTYVLPSTWTGAIDAKVKWFSGTTTGDVVWQIATICVADGETDDPTFNTADAFTADTAKGTANQTNDATKTGITTTGCAAGELMHIKILRDPTNGSDTHAATARLIGVELTIREAI